MAQRSDDPRSSPANAATTPKARNLKVEGFPRCDRVIRARMIEGVATAPAAGGEPPRWEGRASAVSGVTQDGSGSRRPEMRGNGVTTLRSVASTHRCPAPAARGLATRSRRLGGAQRAPGPGGGGQQRCLRTATAPSACAWTVATEEQTFGGDGNNDKELGVQGGPSSRPVRWSADVVGISELRERPGNPRGADRCTGPSTSSRHQRGLRYVQQRVGLSSTGVVVRARHRGKRLRVAEPRVAAASTADLMILQ